MRNVEIEVRALAIVRSLNLDCGVVSHQGLMVPNFMFWNIMNGGYIRIYIWIT